MPESFLSDSLDHQFLLSPLVHSLLQNYSFKNEFLSYCSSLALQNLTVLTWTHLRSFFEHNSWNWSAFIKSNLSSILLEFGFLLSSSVDVSKLPIHDLPDLLNLLEHTPPSKVVFDSEFLSNLNSSSSDSNTSTTELLTTSSEVSSLSPTVSNLGESLTKIVVSPTITIYQFDLPKLFQDLSSNAYDNLFRSRFQQLDQLFTSYYQGLTNKPKYPSSINNIELNERIFITGIIQQTALTSTDLYSTKIQLMNFSFNCSIIASISIQQQSKIPAGLVIGIIGKVTNIVTSSDGPNQLAVSSESWFFPGISSPSKKKTPKVTNESWVVLMGAVDSANKVLINKIYSKFSQWLIAGHDNFRITYCIFLGGVLNTRKSLSHADATPYAFDFEDQFDFDYSDFKSFLDRIPSTIQTFILPSGHDLTNQFIPQPDLADCINLSKKHIHYLQNPSLLSIEDKSLLLYNPFQFFSFEPFVNQPEKFGIELLNFRHLTPSWDLSHNVSFPYQFDPLIIPGELDFFLFSHPSQSTLSLYKNINILSIASTIDEDSSSFPVLIFNLHTQEKKVITIDL